jgi:hypothetical protein
VQLTHRVPNSEITQGILFKAKKILFKAKERQRYRERNQPEQQRGNAVIAHGLWSMEVRLHGPCVATNGPSVEHIFENIINYAAKVISQSLVLKLEDLPDAVKCKINHFPAN